MHRSSECGWWPFEDNLEQTQKRINPAALLEPKKYEPKPGLLPLKPKYKPTALTQPTNCNKQTVE